jgi:hypothetical protein
MQLAHCARRRLRECRNVAHDDQIERAIVEGQLGHFAARGLAGAGIDDLEVARHTIESIREVALRLAEEQHALAVGERLEVNGEREIRLCAG